jgi:hypothetical protein
VAATWVTVESAGNTMKGMYSSMELKLRNRLSAEAMLNWGFRQLSKTERDWVDELD